MTDEGNFCYKVMPFGLKNAGDTYQRLMDRIFKDHIGNQVEVYVDDLVLKLKTKGGYVSSLLSIFKVLRKHHLKLNPKKCSFGIRAGKFLDFVLTQRAFQELKAMLSTHPILTQPKAGAKQRYQKIKRVVLAIINTARRLRPYLQSHPVVCRTNFSIQQILRKPDLAGRMTGWAIELSKFEEMYERREHMRAQLPCTALIYTSVFYIN
ncbi:Retrovirus-related Pol polyprotein from transposon 17.6, partial [Mucuna pruriens]